MSEIKNGWEQAVLWLRNQPDQASLVTDAYYDDPLEAAASRYEGSEEWRAIRQIIGERSGLALDVGAGRGIASYALAKAGFKVDALEPNSSAFVGAEAIRRLADATGLPIVVTAELSEKLPYADAQFDVVFARAVLHHTQAMAAATSEIHRVLRPGGLFLAVREHVISRREDLPEFLRVHPLHRLYGGENAFLLEEYHSAIAAGGFRKVQTLNPLASPVNYAPHTRQSLRCEMVSRAARAGWAKSLLGLVFENELIFDFALSVADRFDHRPGRLYSFIAEKSAD